MLARRIDGLDARAPDRCLREIDQRQRHGAIAAAAGVGENDRESRGLAIRHRHLLAVEGDRRRTACACCAAARLRALGDRQRADRLAGRELRQPLLLLRFGPASFSASVASTTEGVERHRRGRAADLLGDDAKLERRQAEPAIPREWPWPSRRARSGPSTLVGVGFVAVEHAPPSSSGICRRGICNLLLSSFGRRRNRSS